MAYGDDYPDEELEFTEFLFRINDLVDEWGSAFFKKVWAPYGEDAMEQMAVERSERRLEDTALELALYLKARRLEREESPEGRRLRRVDAEEYPDQGRDAG